jgi:uncharacterized membrane protein
MKSNSVIFGSVFVSLVALDTVWIGSMADPLYRAELGDLLTEQPVWWAAMSFYLLHAMGLTVFVTAPAVASSSLQRTLLLGGLFGLCAYGTYDLTNLATLRGWSTLVTFADMAWGAVVSAIASLMGYLVARRLT